MREQLPVGRRVWVRMGTMLLTSGVVERWSAGDIVAATSSDVTVAVAEARIHIHESVWRRDLRLSDPGVPR